MKSGDMIEWTYKHSGELVREDETLWSSMMERFVPIGGEAVHFLVFVNDETYSWLNENGLFHARVDDPVAGPGYESALVVVPRTRANL